MTAIQPRIETDAEYEIFCRKIHSLTGIDLGSYKGNQMRRRIRSMAGREGVDHVLEYAKLLEGDAKLLSMFLDRVTINVSELFRNPEKFAQLESQFLRPMARATSSLKIWSAGCSYGAEIYSVAMILDGLGGARRDKLVGSDIDVRILERARNGLFTGSDMKNVSPPQMKRYFTQTGDDEWTICAELRGRVEFRRQDLLRDRFDSGFDVILCRNVVIYFTDEAKDSLYRRFYEALRPGGILFVGGTERIIGSREIGFETPQTFFYQRPA